MRLKHNQHKYIYQQLVKDVRESGAKLLFVPLMTVDALSGARILSVMFQQLDQHIPQSIMPIRGMMDLKVTVEHMIAETDLTSNALSIVLIGHGAGLDLSGMFHLTTDLQRKDRVFFTVFDAHRPIHLRNLIAGNDQVRIMLDNCDSVDAWEEHLPLDIPSDDEDFFYTHKSQYIEFAEDDDEFNDAGGITHAELQRRYRESIRTIGEYEEDEEENWNDEDDELQDDAEPPTTQGYDDEHFDLDEDDEITHGDTTNRKKQRQIKDNGNNNNNNRKRNSNNNNSQDENDGLYSISQQDDDDDDEFNNQHLGDDDISHLLNDDDDDFGISYGKKRKRNQSTKPKKLTKAQLKAQLKEQLRLEREQRRAQRVSYEDIANQYGREPMARKDYEKLKSQWYARQTYGVPTAILLYDIAKQRRVDHPSFLWAALLGLHETYMFEKCTTGLYKTFYDILKDSDLKHQQRQLEELDPQQQQQGPKRSNHAAMKLQYLALKTEEEQFEINNVKEQHGRHVSSGTLIHKEEDSTHTDTRDTKTPPLLRAEQELVVDKYVSTQAEYIFPFFRHWTFYDTLTNCPEIILAFNLFRSGDTGYAKLKRTFPSIIPLNEAQNTWSLLSKARLVAISKYYAGLLSEQKVGSITNETFIRKYNANIIVSLTDMVCIILQYLSGVCTQRAAEMFKTKSTDGQNTIVTTNGGPSAAQAAKSAVGLVRHGANTLTTVMGNMLSIQPLEPHVPTNHQQSLLVNHLLEYNNSLTHSNNGGSAGGGQRNRTINGDEDDDNHGEKEENKSNLQFGIERLGNNSLFWPAYNFLGSANHIEAHFMKAGLNMAMKQAHIINLVAQNIVTGFLQQEDGLHYCIIGSNSSTGAISTAGPGGGAAAAGGGGGGVTQKKTKTSQKMVILSLEYLSYLSNYYALTQLAFRIQENVPPTASGVKQQSLPIILCLELPFQNYSMVLGINPIILTRQQHEAKVVTAKYQRNTYSQFTKLFADAAAKMGVDILSDSFEYNMVYIKNEDCLKFIKQVSFLAITRKDVRDNFYPM